MVQAQWFGVLGAVKWLGVVGVMAGVAVLAAAPQEAAAQDARPRPIVFPDPGDQARITIDFPGGLLKEFVAEAKRSSTGPMNVMMSQEAELVTVPRIQLNDAPAFAVFMGLRMAVGSVNGRMLAVDVIPQMNPVGGHVFTISLSPTDPRSKPAEQAHAAAAVHVFSVRDLVEAPEGPAGVTLTIDGILTAISATLEMQDLGGEPPKVRYHKETGVVIARATVEGLKAIDQLLGTLRQDEEKRRERAEDARESQRWAREQEIEYSAKIKSIGAELSVRHEELAAAEAEMGRIKAVLSRNPEAPGYAELEEEVKVRLAKARAGVQVMSNELERLRMLRSLRTGGTPPTGEPESWLRERSEEIRRNIEQMTAELDQVQAAQKAEEAKKQGGR